MNLHGGGGVTSNTAQIRQTSYPAGSNIPWLQLAANKESPEQGTVTSVIGGVLSESNWPGSRYGFVPILFDPPRRRTTFTVTYLRIALPHLTLAVTGSASFEIKRLEIQFGWIVGVVVDGVIYYSEPIAPEVLEVEKVPDKPVLKANIGSLAPLSQQLTFSDDIVVGPGSTIETRVAAYVSVKKLEPNGEGYTWELATASEIEGLYPGPVNFAGTLVYQQSFHR